MSTPLPEALRWRFQRVIEERLSGRAAVLRFKLLSATGARWTAAIHRTGSVRAAPQGRPRGKGKLDPHRLFCAEVIAQGGDMTMLDPASALHDATGARAPECDWKVPPQARLYAQKWPLGATERRRTKVKRQRADWVAHRIPAVSAQLERAVFIDETSVKTNLTRLWGWAPRGERLVMDAPLG